MNPNRFLFLILFQILSTVATGQLSQPQLDALVNKYTQSLRNKGVDTIFTYNEFCIGCVFHPANGTNLCEEKFSSLPTYIFWKDKGKTFATRKDICYDYTIQPLAIDSFWNYFFANKEKIRKEKLITPQYVEIENGKKNIRTIDIDESIFFRLTLTTKKETLTKDINSFFLTKELGADGELNINYETNIQTSLNRVHSILQNIIKQEAVRSRFVSSLR